MTVSLNGIPLGDFRAIVVRGDKSIRLYDPATVWDDMQVQISGAKLPAANAPTWRTHSFGIGGGVAFDVLGFALSDYINFSVQTSHRQSLNSVLHHHFHWTIPSDSVGKKFKFQLDVIAASVSGVFAAAAGSPFVIESTLASGDATKHQLSEWPAIPALNSTVSTIYECRMTRIAASANEYANEVYLIGVDTHFLIDTMGSLSEYAK